MREYRAAFHVEAWDGEITAEGEIPVSKLAAEVQRWNFEEIRMAWVIYTRRGSTLFAENCVEFRKAAGLPVRYDFGRGGGQ